MKQLIMLILAFALIASALPAAAAPPEAPPEAPAASEYRVNLPLLSAPEAPDEPTVGYATGADRTLIRWFCTAGCDTRYEVYRAVAGGRPQLVATVGREGDADAAIKVLNSTDARWPDLYKQLRDDYRDQAVNDIPSLYAMLDGNPLAAQKLTNEYYPVALINGWGYLDRDIAPGTTYEYRVVRAADDAPLGAVKLVAGQITPLAAPKNVQAADLDPATSALTHAKTANWAAAQADRRFHQAAYLRWDVGEPQAQGAPAAWVTGYDIFRAPAAAPDAYIQVNGATAVQPIGAAVPDIGASPVLIEGAAEADYQRIEHFYADKTDRPGDYLYRVAPRDALGQVRQWPANRTQFSGGLKVAAKDFMPPLPPQAFKAEVNAAHTQVLLSWELPSPPADLAGFRLERTLASSTAPAPASCADEAQCWVQVATPGRSVFQWTDSAPEREQVRWYRLQAVDAAGNRSMYTMPVHATLHDIEAAAAPTLDVSPCGKTPSDPTPEYCLDADGADDVTRYLVGCTFEPGGQEVFLVERAAVNGDMPALTVTALYDPPFPLDDVPCTVRAVDERGNISPPSAPAVIEEWKSEQPPALPAPILTGIATTALDEAGNATAEVRWEMPASPAIRSFRLERERITGAGSTTATIAGIAPGARSYADAGVRAGELYQYTVVAELAYGMGELSSEPQPYRAVSDGRRPLVRFELTNLSWNAASGTSLAWNSCPPGTTVDGSFRYAVFRSVEQDRGYTQITPIFPKSACAASYVDASARHGRYFYSVMQFDVRTGEPIGYSIPAQVSALYSPQSGPSVRVPAGQGLVQSTIYDPGQQIFIPNCTAVSPAGNDFSQPLRFGDGYEVHNLSVTLAGTAINGSGNLRVTSAGKVVNIPVTFGNITLGDAQNRVCGGSLTVNVASALGKPLVVAAKGRLTYEVLELTVRPFFGNVSHGSGKLRLVMPRSLRVLDADGAATDTLTIGGPQVQIGADLDFSLQTNLSQIANHGCAAGQSPILGFSLETLPVVVVPTGVVSVTPAGIEAAGSCMDYDERYNPAAANGYARPAADNLAAGDSNDGFLRARYAGQADGTRVTPAGLAGVFTTTAPMSYVASYPYGFSLELGGAKRLTLEASQITGGSLGAGTAAFTYGRTATEQPQQKVTVMFSDLAVDARGGLSAAVTPATASVEWMLPNGFVTGLLNTELYLGPVASDQRPGQTIGGVAASALWAARPADAVDLGLGQPATLEPGLNLRRADHTFFWKTCTAGQMAALPAVVDSYIRHGGVSERFRATIAEDLQVSIHGYRAAIEAFELSFLDNLVVGSNIMGDVDLPFPADINLRFISMWFGLDGCVGGGELANAFENLAYWNTNVKLNHAQFADEGALPALPAYPGWDRVLRAIGALELPHLALPGQKAPTLIGVGIGFRPDGNPHEAIRLAANRPSFTLDGFPLLLTGMRLSALNEAADWDNAATAAAPPSTNWGQRGFVEVQGAIAAPYFGLLAREGGAPGDYPAIQMQLHDDYVGFTEQLKGARVWVDLAVVRATHEFRNLVYASSELEGHGLLVGFREYEFVPDAGIAALGLPPAAKLLHMDAGVVIEPVNVHFFLGQSSGTAAFRAMAEARDGQSPPPPSVQTMGQWATHLGMSQAAADGYAALAAAVWPTYGSFASPTYLITTQVLNAYDTQVGLPDSDEFGGGTLGAIELIGVEFNKMRGHVEVDGIGLGMQLEAMEAAMELVVRQFDEPQPLLSLDLVSLIITRYGDYIVEGVNLQSALIGNQLALDATLIYSPAAQLIEGGVGLHKDIDLLHRLEMWNISLNEATGAAAMGAGNLRYVGLNLEASWNFVPFKAGAFGGQVLVGTINPSSPVLRNHFPDVLDHLDIVPAAPGADGPATELKGGYVRLYGDVTQGNRKIAKVLTVNGGLRFGGWYWSNEGGGEYYGGLAGMFVHTNYLKVVSARGDLTFTYERTPAGEQLSAETWVAGGIGSCEPETWTSWASRWWNDKWCWSAGAQAELTYNTATDDFDADWDMDLELGG